MRSLSKLINIGPRSEIAGREPLPHKLNLTLNAWLGLERAKPTVP